MCYKGRTQASRARQLFGAELDRIPIQVSRVKFAVPIVPLRGEKSGVPLERNTHLVLGWGHGITSSMPDDERRSVPRARRSRSLTGSGPSGRCTEAGPGVALTRRVRQRWLNHPEHLWNTSTPWYIIKDKFTLDGWPRLSCKSTVSLRTLLPSLVGWSKGGGAGLGHQKYR